LGDEETPEHPDETVTFNRGKSSDSGGTPAPRPADLFEASPDPILYFDDSGEGPVVRAANPAFEGVFGLTSTAVEDAALGDALMVTGRNNAIVRAASTGADFQATVPCETAEGEVPCAIRLATVTDEVGVRGYVIYTPTST
ncbi:MAG: PAS domain-containing protein, partial [Haloarculaceae archaeon]